MTIKTIFPHPNDGQVAEDDNFNFGKALQNSGYKYVSVGNNAALKGPDGRIHLIRGIIHTHPDPSPSKSQYPSDPNDYTALNGILDLPNEGTGTGLYGLVVNSNSLIKYWTDDKGVHQPSTISTREKASCDK